MGWDGPWCIVCVVRGMMVKGSWLIVDREDLGRWIGFVC